MKDTIIKEFRKFINKNENSINKDGEWEFCPICDLDLESVENWLEKAFHDQKERLEIEHFNELREQKKEACFENAKVLATYRIKLDIEWEARMKLILKEREEGYRAEMVKIAKGLARDDERKMVSEEELNLLKEIWSPAEVNKMLNNQRIGRNKVIEEFINIIKSK